VPAGGLSPDHTRWVHARDNYFLSKKVLCQVFRGKFVDALQQAFQKRQLNFHADLKLLANPKTFAAWLRPLFRKQWVVYLNPPFGGPAYVLQYLGRYTHRVAISNHRLVSFADGQVTFRWRDSADGNKQKLLPLSVNEFLTRFLLHILPQGFVRIRNFGFLANRRRTTLLPLCFQLLGASPEPLTEQHTSSTEQAPDLYPCPNCGGPMKVIQRLTAAEIQLRSSHGRRCIMKRLSTTIKVLVLRRAPHPYSLPANKSFPPASSITIIAIPFRPSQFPAVHCYRVRSTAQPRQCLTPISPHH
jgi:putative transposase